MCKSECECECESVCVYTIASEVGLTWFLGQLSLYLGNTRRAGHSRDVHLDTLTIGRHAPFVFLGLEQRGRRGTMLHGEGMAAILVYVRTVYVYVAVTGRKQTLFWLVSERAQSLFMPH